MILETGQKSSSSEGGKKNVPKPPDGGWGWWVVAASFLIHVVADGVAYTFGLFFVKICEDFKESKSATSWIASIMAGMTYGVGPLAGAVVNTYGCRVVSITGSIIAAFGFAISYFAQCVEHLYLSIGVIGGLGLGLIYLPAIVSVTIYFEKKRAFATGIAVCGSGAGTFILAPFIEWLIRACGWRMSLVVTGGIILLCFVFSLFFRPLEDDDYEDSSQDTIPTIVEPDEDDEEEREAVQPLMKMNGSLRPKAFNLVINDTPLTMSCSQPALKSIVAESTDSLPRMGRLTTKRHSLKTLEFGSNAGLRTPTQTPHTGVILQRKDIFYSGSLVKLSAQLFPSNGNLPMQTEKKAVYGETEDVTDAEEMSEFKKVFKAMMDLSLLKNPIFLFFAFSNFFTSIGYNVPYIYLVDKAAGDSSAPKNDLQAAGFLLAIVGISNTLSRVMLGYLSDKPWVNRLYLYNTALIICGLATGICSHTDNINLLRLYAATFGATVGVYVSLTSVILVDLLGLGKLTNAFGLLLLFQGIATVVGPPMVGLLFDIFGDYEYGFWLAGGMICLSGGMLFLIPLLERKSNYPNMQQADCDTDGTNNEHIVIYCPGEKGRKGSNNNVSKY
ncbi:monocarboxylate transporter 1 [Folsomia candida]|uniref:monocarboxylate transporter 1 n=1 Tax=Folsomia candida TaxID=158441 RepID=UPI000B8F3D78|nr:monocarboxylate transporter 1 [Folsomia candida]XP_035712773.1 monocarboxylate transporter 1 [Folsomia candida]